MALATPEQQGMTRLVSTFYVGNACFGVDTARVQEIIRIGKITRVHHAPECVLGVMNLRGRIVTIVDLAARLGLEATSCTDEGRVLVVEQPEEVVGLLIDRVSDVVAMDDVILTQTPSNVPELQSVFLEGVYRDEQHTFAILNIDALLALDEDGAR